MPAIHLKKPFRSGSHKSHLNPLIKQKKQALVFDLDAPDGKTLETKAGTVRFEQGMAVVPDDGRAEDIFGEMQQQQKHRDQMALVRHREGMYRDKVHKHFFGSWPEMPWKRNNAGS
jgi:hypothetical protein